MTGKDIYKIWAPYGKRYSPWVRPVPFVDMDTVKELYGVVDYEEEEVFYAKKLTKNTAYILDIDGVNSVREAITLARMGYVPVPLFNGTSPNEGVMATVDNEIIEAMLIWGAYELTNIKIEDDAPPVFLLDKNRLNRYKYDRGEFDNSWDIYAQDMPSADYLLKNKIRKIVVRSDVLRNDLCQILYKYQQKDIKIYFTDGIEEPKLIKINKSKLKAN